MATVELNDRQVAGLRPRAVQVDVWDTKITGLGLRVSPTGAKAWTLRYRIGRRLRRWTIGRYPTVSLAEARKKARKALRGIEDGIDPALEKKDRREADSFAELAEEYVTKYAKPRKRTWKDDQRMLSTEVLPLWRHRPARDITRRDAREMVEDIAERGAPIMANRVRAMLHTLFEFAVSREIVEYNPVTHVEKPGQEHQRDRVLIEDEIRQLWATWDSLPAEMAAFWKLRLLTAQRGGEVNGMRWQDVGLTSGWWTIPAAESKNKLSHRVPLNLSALAILKALRADVDARLTARKAAGKDVKEPIFVLANARGKRQQSEAVATFPVADFRGHDLRRTAASMMTGGGIQRLTVSKILNHAEKGITAVYDRHSYDAEKGAALTWWDAKLTAILQEKSATVLAFTKGA